MSLPFTIVIFLGVLFLLVLVHELGHFFVAKRVGMRVDEFGIGFPPRLCAWRRGETVYSLNLLPIGGFVKIFGEDVRKPIEDDYERARSFSGRPLLAQAGVLVAGVTSNVLLAWILFSVGFMVGMPTVVEEGTPAAEGARISVIEVLPDSPAEAGGLTALDEILELSAGERILVPTGAAEVSAFIRETGPVPILVTYKRGGEVYRAEVTPEHGLIPEREDEALIGVTFGLVSDLKHSFGAALLESAEFTASTLFAILHSFGLLIFGLVSGDADFQELTGPVGIAGLVGSAATLGIIPLLSFAAFISLNLAVINLIPFPALDGGRLLFVGVEALRGRPIKPMISSAANILGFVLLMVLMAIVTYNDIVRLF